MSMPLSPRAEDLKVYNSLTRQKERFEPLVPGQVLMYVCGPTVYSDVHLGNCRTFVNFDVIYRYLLYLGFKVRYVRNITDVGHLVGDVDSNAEDKIAQKAKAEQLEPMEVVQQYTLGFHEVMHIFNTLPPNIEPRATGHIIEQIEMVKAILHSGYAYEKEGSVYFDTQKFAQDKSAYGQLSGRKVEELLANTRDDLKNQDEKNHPSDFAIWIKADPRHLMHWPSPWSEGFPGWHLECSAMSTKYLGKRFDIHGGGNDLKFPHHENEIAQNVAACGCSPANYWLHTNMLLMNGRKMSKSDNNSITPEQLFTGNSEHISKAYHPMVVRFFMLQSHYSSTLDLTDEALLAAEKGYQRLMEAYRFVKETEFPKDVEGTPSELFDQHLQGALHEMNDDFNTPKALASVFALVTEINRIKSGQMKWNLFSPKNWKDLQLSLQALIEEVFGLQDVQQVGDSHSDVLNGLMELILDIRQSARNNKDWDTSDKIRDTLNELAITVKDDKAGSTWSL